MIQQKEIEEAIKTWINYTDSDIYDEDKTRELIKARITIREGFRQGYIMINPHNFNSESATECFTAVRNARRM